VKKNGGKKQEQGILTLPEGTEPRAGIQNISQKGGQFVKGKKKSPKEN